MIIRRKPKPPLAEAAALVEQAVAIVRAYWRNSEYAPTLDDLAQFRRLNAMLLQSHAAVRRIVIRMERRFLGEPEIDPGTWR